MSPPVCQTAFGRSQLVVPGMFVLALGALWLGCSGGDHGDAAPDGAGAQTMNDGEASEKVTATDGGTTSGDANVVVGTFSVTLHDAQGTNPAYAAVAGSVFDGPTLAATQLVKAATDGDCTLFTPYVPVCVTACGGTATCVADGVCHDNPTTEDVGTITLVGVADQAGTSPLTLTSVEGNYSAAGDQEPAYPPFAEGADVEVRATAGAAGAFSIHAKGIAPLVLASATITVATNQPLTLSWTAAGPAATSTIHAHLDISHHGGLKGEIDCDTADSGSLTISAALVTQLVNLGYAGYPSVTVSRSAVGSTLSSLGLVELRLGEDLIRDVEIPGLVSCQGDGDCPADQTCQTDLRCK